MDKRGIQEKQTFRLFAARGFEQTTLNVALEIMRLGAFGVVERTVVPFRDKVVEATRQIKNSRRAFSTLVLRR